MMELSKHRKEYLKKWWKEHDNYMRDYARENRIKFNKSLIEWKKKNPDKVKINILKDKERHKDKILSRARANNNNLIGSKCQLCLSQSNLVFHHIDYTNDIGITLCRICHGKIHRKGD